MKIIVIGNVNHMTKPIITKNAKRLIEQIYDKHFQGLIIDNLYKQHEVCLGS